MIRALLPLCLLLAGCPVDDTGDWPDPDTDSEADTDSDTDTDTDSDTTPTGFTTHCGTLTEDERWTASGNPHFIGCDVAIEGARITIEAGVELRPLTGTRIAVSEGGRGGALIIEGTEQDPVVFEPEDPNAGAGAWEGIDIYADAEEVRLTWTEVRKAGAGSRNGAIVVRGNTLSVDHLTIADSAGTALFLGIDGRLDPASAGLVISGSGGWPVTVEAAHAHTVPALDSEYTDNPLPGVEIRQDTIIEQVTWEDLGVPYIATGTISVGNTRDRPALLTIDAGTTLLFDVGRGLVLAPGGGEAGLVVAGTAGAPVLLSSLGAATGGYWAGITANPGTSRLELRHATVEWGGGSAAARSSFDVARTELLVEHVTIRTSEKLGVSMIDGARFADGSTDLTITGCAFPALVPSVHADTIPDGTYAGNTVDAFQLAGDISGPVHWPALDVPYWIATDIFLDGISTRPATLTIDPGTTVWFANGTKLDLSFRGGAAGLVAEGTATEPIVFTAAEFAESGAWEGLHFRDMCEEDEVRLAHVVVEYGGGSLARPANLYFSQCNPARLRHVVTRYSGTIGLALVESEPADWGDITYVGNFQDLSCGQDPCPTPN